MARGGSDRGGSASYEPALRGLRVGRSRESDDSIKFQLQTVWPYRPCGCKCCKKYRSGGARRDSLWRETVGSLAEAGTNRSCGIVHVNRNPLPSGRGGRQVHTSISIAELLSYGKTGPN